jgi:hypothetical protein
LNFSNTALSNFYSIEKKDVPSPYNRNDYQYDRTLILEVIMAMFNLQRNTWAWSGLFFIALFGMGFLLSVILSSEPYPSPFGAPYGFATEVESYFTNNQAQVQWMSFFYSLAALMLLIFAVGIATVVRETDSDAGVLSTLVLSGGILAAVFIQLSALALWILARPATIADSALLRAMHDLAYLTGGPAHVLAFAPFIGASSIVFMNQATFPRWVNWMGMAAAVLSLLSVTALLWLPGTMLLPLGRVLAFGWIFFVSIRLMRGVQVERSQHSSDPVASRPMSKMTR